VAHFNSATLPSQPFDFLGLLTNPAAAAFILVKGYGRALLLSTAFGMPSGVGGFFIAAATNLPAGAMIVIVSSILVGV